MIRGVCTNYLNAFRKLPSRTSSLWRNALYCGLARICLDESHKKRDINMPIWLAILIGSLVVALAIRAQISKVLGWIGGLLIALALFVGVGSLPYNLYHHLSSPDPEESVPFGLGLLLILLTMGPLTVWALARESQAGKVALHRWRSCGILAVVSLIGMVLLAGLMPKSWAALWLAGLTAVSLVVYSLGTCWTWRRVIKEK